MRVVYIGVVSCFRPRLQVGTPRGKIELRCVAIMEIAHNVEEAILVHRVLGCLLVSLG